MRKINKDNWNRKELFDFFSSSPDPFYSVTFPLDVTNLYSFTKKNSISFYYSLVYICTAAINSVENFRYDIQNEEVVLLDKRIPSFTDMKENSEVFHIVTMECNDNIIDFCNAAKQKSISQTSFISQSMESDSLIYFSCLPWFDLTSLTNEKHSDKNDNIPRIAWGKYEDVNNTKKLHLSIEVNHRFIDGIHIGKFYNAANDLIAKLCL